MITAEEAQTRSEEGRVDVNKLRDVEMEKMLTIIPSLIETVSQKILEQCDLGETFVRVTLPISAMYPESLEVVRTGLETAFRQNNYTIDTYFPGSLLTVCVEVSW